MNTREQNIISVQKVVLENGVQKIWLAKMALLMEKHSLTNIERKSEMHSVGKKLTNGKAE